MIKAVLFDYGGPLISYEGFFPDLAKTLNAEVDPKTRIKPDFE